MGTDSAGIAADIGFVAHIDFEVHTDSGAHTDSGSHTDYNTGWVEKVQASSALMPVPF